MKNFIKSSRLTGDLLLRHAIIMLTSSIVGTYIGLACWIIYNAIFDSRNFYQGTTNLMFSLIAGPILFLFVIFFSNPAPAAVALIYLCFTVRVIEHPAIASIALVALAIILFPPIFYLMLFADRMTFYGYMDTDAYKIYFSEILSSAVGIAAVYYLGLQRTRKYVAPRSSPDYGADYRRLR